MAELITPCDDGCIIKYDIDQAIEIYSKLIVAINEDLDNYYEAGRINGSTWAEMATALKSKAIDSAINAVTQLQMKETPMDRAVKQEQIDSSQAKTIRDDELGDKSMEVSDKSMEVSDEQITASTADTTNKTCMATADCGLKDAQTIEVSLESARRDNVTTEQVTASQADTTNKTCVATADCGVKDAQKAKVDYEVSTVLPATVSLTGAQETGFIDNQQIKAAELAMNGWALAYSSGMMGDGAYIPGFITGSDLEDLWDKLADGTGN